MPNKTIYIRDADLPLWDLAQSQLGESVSALFGKFLREKMQMVDAFVHILHSSHPAFSGEGGFIVMFAPTDTNGPMNPHHIPDGDFLVRFLVEIGFTHEAAGEIRSALDTQPSVSRRIPLSRSQASSNFYRVHFKPLHVDAGSQSWEKVQVNGIPISTGGKPLSATFNNVNSFFRALTDQFGSSDAQVSAIHRALSKGNEVELGGMTGAPFVAREERLIAMGLIESQ